MKVFIITGASRGLGAALAKQLAEKKTLIIGICRGRNIQVEKTAMESGAEFRWCEIDLSKTDELIKSGSDFFPLPFRVGGLEEITLINNAAMVEPIGFSGAFDLKKVQQAAALNFTAVAVLSSLFINIYKGLQADKKIINITSGAVSSVLPGLSVYSAAKAAVDMFTKVAGAEQNDTQYGCRIGAVSPGMVDTEMQEKLRKSGREKLPLRDFYIDAMEKGEICSADTAAGKIIRFMYSGFENGTVAHADNIDNS